MALTTKSIWNRTKAWLTRNEPDIVNQLVTTLAPAEVGLASLNEKGILGAIGASAVGGLISQWIRHDQRRPITAIPQDNQQWLVVTAPKRPPTKRVLSQLKVRGMVSSIELAHQ